MKYGFIGLLVFGALFHFVGPYFYYEIYGFSSVYQSQQFFSFDQAVFNKVFLINVVPLLTASVVVYFLPETEKVTPYKTRFSYIFYVLCSLWFIFFLIKAGGHKGILAGNLQGTWYTYTGLFLGLATAFTLTITHCERVNFIILGIGQIILLMIGGSRSAPVALIVNFFILMGVKIPRKKIFQYLGVVCFSVLSSIYFYDVANYFRTPHFLAGRVSFTSVSEFTEGVEEAGGGRNGLVQIVGRISMLEVGMLPIIYKDIKHDKESMDIFHDKYSLKNQFGLFKNYFLPAFLKKYINDLSPNFFRRDTFPNQYYRVSFLKEPMENIKKSYMSVNMGFPVYVYMWLSNFYLAAFIYTASLIFLYLLIAYTVKRFSTGAVLLFYASYEFIVFFDFTQNLVVLLRAFFTLGTFILIYKIIPMIFTRLYRSKKWI